MRKLNEEELKEYFIKVDDAKFRNPDWRLGQVYFNVLTGWYADIADELRGGDFDPFFDNSKIDKFINEITE